MSTIKPGITAAIAAAAILTTPTHRRGRLLPGTRLMRRWYRGRHRMRKGRITIAQLAARLMLDEAITQIIPTTTGPNVMRHTPNVVWRDDADTINFHTPLMVMSGHTLTQPIPAWKVLADDPHCRRPRICATHHPRRGLLREAFTCTRPHTMDCHAI